MTGTHVDVSTPDGIADAYLAMPDGENHGGVLLLMDAFGLRPAVEQIADRIAGQGYAVLAPNVFYRAGRAPVLPFPDLTEDDARAQFFADVRPLMEELTPERIASDGAAYLDELEKVADGPFGVTGYCFGARLGLRIANSDPERVVALGGFHGGRMVADGPDSPHRNVAAIAAEVYFGHADNDHSNSPEQIEALDAALDEAGVEHTTEVYEGAGHGYTQSDTPVYDEAATERHYGALFELLERRL